VLSHVINAGDFAVKSFEMQQYQQARKINEPETEFP